MEEVEAGYEEIEKQIEEEIRQRREKHNKPQRINASVLRRRCLPADAQGLEEDELVERLFNLTHVRLDRERIVTLDGIDMLGKVTNLYLQHNRISRIDNLDLLPSLRFLVLANNCIAKIENVSMLKNLQFFDVQHNEIENIEAGDLPTSLLFFNYAGNPCSAAAEVRQAVVASLPLLVEMDGEEIGDSEKERAREALRLPPLSSAVAEAKGKAGAADVITLADDDEEEGESGEEEEVEEEEVEEDEDDAPLLRAFTEGTTITHERGKGRIGEEEWSQLFSDYARLGQYRHAPDRLPVPDMGEGEGEGEGEEEVEEKEEEDGEARANRGAFEFGLDLSSALKAVEKQAEDARSAREGQISSFLERLRSEHDRYTHRKTTES